MVEYWKNLSLENLFYTDEFGILQEEEWRAVINFENLYFQSDLGRIKALERTCVNSIRIKKTYKEKIIKQSVSTDGYLRLVLTKNKKPYYFKTHQLVAICYLGHIKNGYKRVVDHKNDYKLDNRAVNLQLLTSRQNSSKNKLKNNPYTGISFDKRKEYWRVSIQINGKNIALGTHKIPENASEIYVSALNNINNYNGNNDEFRNLIRSKL